jgi:hypothetical protein
MFSLQDNDVLIEGTRDPISHATAYYKSLFGHVAGNILDFDANMWKPHEKLTEEDNLVLARPFTLEEAKMHCFLWHQIKPLALITSLLSFNNTVVSMLSATL